MLKRCISCCGEDDDEPDPKRPVAPLKPQPRNSWETPGRVTPRRDAVLQFAGSRWLVNRSADHGGKLYWTNIDTKQTTWRQRCRRRARRRPTLGCTSRCAARC